MTDWQVSAFTVAARIPSSVWRPIGAAGAAVLARRPPRPLRQWALNAEVVTGRPQTRADLRAAQASWFRNTVGSLRLGHLAGPRIVDMVRVDESRMDWLRELHATRGLVLALPHQGSWDLAGAYACQVGLPVTAVAERLPPDQYAYFREMRTHLGFEIHPHDVGNLIATLSSDLRRGRVVCLVADRDFSRRGLQVAWPTPTGPRAITVPAGPHVISARTGAALVGVSTWFDGPHLRIELSEEITGDMTDTAQSLTDFFAESIRSHVHDWHLMQRFFPGVVA